MPETQVKAMRRRSQPRQEVEPIHLDELLGAAGMSGFLGVLDAPAVAPHMSDAFGDLAVAGMSQQGKQLTVWFANQVESLVGSLGRQQELLYGVTEVARRMSGSAQRLALRAEGIRLKKGEKDSGKGQTGTQTSRPQKRRSGTELGGMDRPEWKDAIAR